MGFLDSAFSGVSSAVIGGVGGLLGNSSAAAEASKNRDWQTYMSSTSHQREVKDLKKAGLNPILSAGGSGAAMGSGATAAQVNPFAGVPDAINSSRKIDEVEKKAIELKGQEVANDTERAKSQVSLQDEMKNTEVARQQELATQQILNTEQAALARQNSVKAILDRDNITKQGAYLDASTQRELSQAGLNSAYAGKTISDKVLTDREIKSGRYEAEVKQYSRPLREVFDTLGPVVKGLFNAIK